MIETQDAFVARRRADWDALQAIVLPGQALHRFPPATISQAAARYRAVCADLMRARAAGYGADVVALLDGLAARSHALLYRAPPYQWDAFARLITGEFARTVRRHLRFLLFTIALLLVPFAVGFTGARSSRAFALQIVPEDMAEQMEEAYAHDMSQGRDESVDASMAGFYVRNNIGVAFRCFATGILFGLGTVFFLIYNGLLTGVVAGLVGGSGHGGNLLAFIAGHGAFELTAIAISGQAGLLMGWSLVDTRGLTRMGSLRQHSHDLVQLVVGASLMLVIAAGIEGFWSPSSVPREIKLTVAGSLWVVVIAYLSLAGRSHGARA